MNIKASSYRLSRRLSKVPPPNHSRLIFSRPVDSSLSPHVTFDAPCSSFSLVNRLRIFIFKQLHFAKRRIDSEVVFAGYQRWLNVLKGNFLATSWKLRYSSLKLLYILWRRITRAGQRSKLFSPSTVIVGASGILSTPSCFWKDVLKSWHAPSLPSTHPSLVCSKISVVA